MLKNISNLGKVLTKEAQKSINGGGLKRCSSACSFTGQNCYYQGHCSCPGQCGNQPGQGLTCIPW